MRVNKKSRIVSYEQRLLRLNILYLSSTNNSMVITNELQSVSHFQSGFQLESFPYMNLSCLHDCFCVMQFNLKQHCAS